MYRKNSPSNRKNFLTITQVNQHNSKYKYVFSFDIEIENKNKELIHHIQQYKTTFIGMRNNKPISSAQITKCTDIKHNPLKKDDFIKTENYIMQIDELYYQQKTSNGIKKKFIEFLIKKLFIKNSNVKKIEVLFDNDFDHNRDSYQFTQNGFKLNYSKVVGVNRIPYYSLCKDTWLNMTKKTSALKHKPKTNKK